MRLTQPSREASVRGIGVGREGHIVKKPPPFDRVIVTVDQPGSAMDAEYQRRNDESVKRLLAALKEKP